MAGHRKFVKKTVKKTVQRKHDAPRAVADVFHAEPVAKPVKNKVVRKWLYQCAYWRVCNSCSLKNECLNEMKKQGVEKNWINEQVNGINPRA
ncbi:hypothetical protein COX86_00300 [Candidatus Micrarchaeota archaeon CG_4_10_14_0_2_um_filter_60_11]|nr:MAG: hypothetical protein AUJ16_02610 [Candidatus Micrarchaeota archaeon CG1_02_60_51]PIN96290.1 MAG: hypothetical protein COU39_01765 [Candidatus Micrarchaeota archaeon CG10_big_fil_rev_8_21_14_0_10_60_32]PIO01972.1 MAG: hypothetical protein COT58_02500 [Candidatus Micrarchaeota archaeon CG09_land_8_20_14_0_10_60_16]PIZ91315.1 MAG: hypothetical protein COX86_00300 [Candidatus Micrarchaeota archaeon CG_4_10_14_0_2_um_filter_60_11]